MERVADPKLTDSLRIFLPRSLRHSQSTLDSPSRASESYSDSDSDSVRPRPPLRHLNSAHRIVMTSSQARIQPGLAFLAAIKSGNCPAPLPSLHFPFLPRTHLARVSTASRASRFSPRPLTRNCTRRRRRASLSAASDESEWSAKDDDARGPPWRREWKCGGLYGS